MRVLVECVYFKENTALLRILGGGSELCHFFRACEHVFGFGFFCVSDYSFFPFYFFVCPSLVCMRVPDCVRVGSRRHFVTAALLIFATIKTPCGAQCSESQH